MTSRSLRSTLLYLVLPLTAALATAGVAIYLTHGAAPSDPKAKYSANPASPLSPAAAAKFACPVTLPPASSSEESHAIDRQAQKLMGNGQFEKALASYRKLAEQDPAFPGINLDLSMAFSKLNQPLPAKQAIDAQLAISMCLAQLFPNELEPYCKAEGFSSNANCVKEIGSVQQGAYIQAALVQMDVEHGVKAGATHKPSDSIQVAELKVPNRTSAVTKDAVKLKIKAPAKSAHNALAAGDGTDAALGAYSK